MLKRLGLLLLPALALHATVALPQGQYQTSYDITLDAGWPDVTNIFLVETGAFFGSGTWAFTAYGNDTLPSTTTLTNPFTHPGPVLSTLMYGIATDFTGDPAGQKHFVLFADPTTVSLMNGIAWGTIFPTVDEDQLIAALELATSGQDWPIIQPGLDALDGFNQGPAQNILGPGGFTHSAWFDTGGAFDVIAFSNGQVIGSGTSANTFIPDASTPEPASFLLAGGAMLAFGIRIRRKQSGTTK